MEVIQDILRFLDFQLDAAPEMYGAFHLSFFAASFVAAFVLCLLWKLGVIKDVKKVVLITAIIVLVFEIYKQINFTFGYTDGITVNYQWYAFPFQFCSTPLFVGLLCGLTRGKVNQNFAAYLATYALFAGLGVMFYPATVFVPTLGISIQTMICHGSMITIAIFLFYTGYVKAERATILKALPVFVAMVGIAVTLNEIAYLVGLTETHTFNMFFISSHFESDLPVYSLVHNALYLWEPPFGYIICVILYIAGFTAAAFAILHVPILVKYIKDKDFDADYAEEDAARAAEEEKKQKDKRDLDAANEKIRELEAKLAEKEKAAEQPAEQPIDEIPAGDAE